MTKANEQAMQWLDAFPDWPLWQRAPSFLLVGNEGAGKSHFLHIFAARTKAPVLHLPQLTSSRAQHKKSPLIIDDLHQLCQQPHYGDALFHLMNDASAQGRALLFASATMPHDWREHGLTADLLSRLTSLAVLRLSMDDELLMGILLKMVQERGLLLPHHIARWLITRVPRVPHEMKHFADALANHIAHHKAPLTLPLVKEIAAEMGWHGV